MSLGNLIDQANEDREKLEHLIWEITGGAVSKARTDLSVVREFGALVSLRRFVNQNPDVLDSEAFRKAIEFHHGGRQLEEMDRDRRDGASGLWA